MKGNTNRGVAQLASASGLGPEGPVFESQYPDKAEAEMFPLFLYTPNSMMQTMAQRKFRLNEKSGLFCVFCIIGTKHAERALWRSSRSLL